MHILVIYCLSVEMYNPTLVENIGGRREFYVSLGDHVSVKYNIKCEVVKEAVLHNYQSHLKCCHLVTSL